MRRPRHHIHDVTIDGEGHDEIGVELVESALDRLRHAADHPEREGAVDTAQNPAAKDDISTSVVAKARERDGCRIALGHEAVEVVDQRTGRPPRANRSAR